jgi:hypothetical protein
LDSWGRDRSANFLATAREYQRARQVSSRVFDWMHNSFLGAIWKTVTADYADANRFNALTIQQISF